MIGSADAGGLAIVAATAFGTGVTMGVTGIGAALLVPVLMVLAGMPVHLAAGTVLASTIATGVLSAWMHGRRGAMQWRLVWPLFIGGVPGGWTGATLAAGVPSGPLTATIGGLIIAASLAAMRQPTALAVRPRSRAAEDAVLIGIGAVAGLCAGLSGAGGPIFSVPMMLAAGFAPLATVGASSAFMIAAAGSGTVANLRASLVDLVALAAMTPFLLAGIASGVRIAHALPVLHVKRAALGLCVIAGLLMVWRAFVTAQVV